MLLLTACLPEIGTVSMFGEVHDAPYAEGALVEGVTLETRNQGEELIGSAASDGNGAFTVDVPAGVDFFVELRHDGHVPTHFSGVAGLYDFYSGDGYPWIAPEAYVEQLRADFAACASADDPGGIVMGEVRLYIDGIYPGDAPIIDTAEVYVYNSVTKDEQAACYLDDAGTSLPDGKLTGATGRFAVFGVPPGLIAVEVLYNDPAGDEVSSHPQYLLAEDGIVPMFPAWAYVAMTEG